MSKDLPPSNTMHSGIEAGTATAPKSKARWLKRLGVGAFLFFFIKGLAWLAIGAAAAFGLFKAT